MLARNNDIDFRQIVLMIVVVLVGAGLTWSATHQSIRNAETEARAKFDASAGLYTDRVKGSLEHGLEAAADLFSYYQASGDMTAETFQRLVSSYSSINEHRVMVGVAIAAGPEDIPTIESYTNERYATDFQIKKSSSARAIANLSGEEQARAFYMVYVWAPVAERAERWRGADFGSYPPVNEFLEEVLMRGTAAAIPLPPIDMRGKACVLLASPFRGPEGFNGLILQVVDLTAMLDSVVSSPRFETMNITLSSDWSGGKQDHSIMVRNGEFSNDQLPPPAMRPWIARDTVSIGSQVWQFQPWAKFAAYKVDYGGAVITASVCLLLTGLVVFIVWSQSQRSKRVVEIVDRRTRALKEAHEELEDHYRMLQNLNRDVEEARLSAETANRAKSEFLATMSHELRTPLNAILGFSQILQEQALGDLGDQRYVDYAKDINSSGTHLLAIINDILDLAKLEAGKIQIEQNVLSSRLLVGRVETLLAQQAEAKGIVLDAEFATNMPDYILGDELRLRQILINLGSNAIKFTNSGSVIIRLHPRPFPTGQHGWVLEVEDTGIGIAEEKQETLFDRFTQVDAALSRRHGGVGLGLAICRELVDQMNGKISVRSMVNVGTTIRVHLPLIEANTEDEDDGMI